HVGIDLDRDRAANLRLTPSQAPARQIAHGNLAEFESSSFGRSQTVNELRARLRFNFDASFAYARNFHLRRIFILYYERDVAGRAICDFDAHFGFGADGEPAPRVNGWRRSLTKIMPLTESRRLSAHRAAEPQSFSPIAELPRSARYQ